MREELPTPNSPCRVSPLAGHSGDLAAFNRIPWLLLLRGLRGIAEGPAELSPSPAALTVSAFTGSRWCVVLRDGL